MPGRISVTIIVRMPKKANTIPKADPAVHPAIFAAFSNWRNLRLARATFSLIFPIRQQFRE